MKKVEERLVDRDVKLQLLDSAIEFLAERGYDPVFGARPVKRAVQRELESALAKASHVSKPVAHRSDHYLLAPEAVERTRLLLVPSTPRSPPFFLVTGSCTTKNKMANPCGANDYRDHCNSSALEPRGSRVCVSRTQGFLRGEFGEGDAIVMSAPGGAAAVQLVLQRKGEPPSRAAQALPEPDHPEVPLSSWP